MAHAPPRHTQALAAGQRGDWKRCVGRPGRTHIIDLARFLVGEVKSVEAITRTFVAERPLPDGSTTGKVDVDDAFVSVVEFENGAIGTLEATRFAGGRKNHQVLEINAEKGSIRFNLERLNELEVFWVGEEPKETQGFHNVLVTEDYHPWWENWWPRGHIIRRLSVTQFWNLLLRRSRWISSTVDPHWAVLSGDAVSPLG